LGSAHLADGKSRKIFSGFLRSGLLRSGKVRGATKCTQWFLTTQTNRSLGAITVWSGIEIGVGGILKSFLWSEDQETMGHLTFKADSLARAPIGV